MASSDTIDGIIQKTRQLMSGNAFTQEFENNFRALLQSQLKHLDLVSREEFEAQCEVLRRSREKIDELEQQLAQLLEQQH